jgi:hypothetical protein
MSKRFDIYGGYSGMVLQAQSVGEEEVRKRFENYLKTCDHGYEIKFECIKEGSSDHLTCEG